MAFVARTEATLRVAGHDLDPSVISPLLGQSPSRAKKSTNASKRGVWLYSAKSRCPGSLDEQIIEIFSSLTNDLAVWSRVTRDYGTDLFCGIFLFERNEGISLSSASLRTLSERNVNLDLDIYYGEDFLQKRPSTRTVAASAPPTDGVGDLSKSVAYNVGVRGTTRRRFAMGADRRCG